MTDEHFYPFIDVAGAPREMGVTHGRGLRDRIHATVKAMRAHVGPEPYDASWSDFQTTLAYCRERAPDLVEEMEGIAEGAEIELRDAFNISAHLDLLRWKAHVWGARGGSGEGACSSHAVVTDSEVLLGWNGDDWRGWMDCGAVVRGRPDRGEPFIYWSLAGSVGRPGMNRHLAMGANSLPTRRWRADGLLYPMLSRKVLACRDAAEAVHVLGKYGRCSSQNYLIADASGALVDVEADTDRLAVLRPADQAGGRYLLHTNCCLDPQLADGEVDPGAACPRLATARRLYRENTPSDAAEVRAVQSDHSGGICVHRPEACTIVSFVAEVRAGRFSVTRGNPCTVPVETHVLDPHFSPAHELARTEGAMDAV